MKDKEDIAKIARQHADSVMVFYSDHIAREAYALRSKNSYQKGYQDAIDWVKQQKDTSADESPSNSITA